MVYDVETPLNEPLGGSESAMCYLAIALAAREHFVVLFRRGEGVFIKQKVHHLPLNKIAEVPLDIFVIQNTPFSAPQIKQVLQNPNTKIVLWSQHASNQPAVEGLADKELINVFDKIVLVSEWQMRDYKTKFGVGGRQIWIGRNAISPAFENLQGKKTPWSMAYTSTPFRGLALLPGIFSQVKAREPSAKLSVFSSMRVYQGDSEKEQNYEKLYQACRETAGVTYVGSLPQKELATKLASTMILAYPNIFPETSCIAVMEAMAAGCQVVTSNLGALPETTARYGRHVDITGEISEFCQNFINELLRPIEKEKIAEQVKYVNANYTWNVRAGEWEEMLSTLS